MSAQGNIRKSPCRVCPYRKDVPSGVWAKEEYDKLPEYDKDTGEQPMAAFVCHATPSSLCAGWATCHGEGLLALRMQQIGGRRFDIPTETIPLFASGKEAAEHGKKDIKNPSPEAIEMMAYLQEKHPRLRT